jgi:D-inositol-3-phosphate glycosyltransferase
VLDGETGYLVPADDPAALAERLRRLIADPQLAQKLGRSGRARAQANFTAEAMARSFESLYREILA